MKPKRTILCVDDNASMLSVRKVILETRGYRVFACSGAEEALAQFLQGGVDLVLSDCVLPGHDGAWLIRQIRSCSPATPTILVSGKIARYDGDAPSDFFLPKGTPPAELLDHIRALLIRKRGPKAKRVMTPPAAAQSTKEALA